MSDVLLSKSLEEKAVLAPKESGYPPQLAIVIPTYNRRSITQACVESLLLNNNLRKKIFICDSNSSDGTRETFVGLPDVTVINAGDDCWWTGAVNRGIEIVLEEDFEFALVMNDDIDIPPLLIDSMLEKASQNPGKIISPAQRTKQGVFLGMNYSGIFKSPIITWASGKNDKVNVESSNGCCLLIPTGTFRKIGLFDEKHCPHLYGDTEFQVRAWKYGLGTRAFSDIVIGQHEGTDYYRRLRFGGLLTYQGSPVHLSSYLTFGRSLFHGWYRFAFFGIGYHRRYLRSLIKSVYILLCRSIIARS